jgi:hypothetical protein
VFRNSKSRRSVQPPTTKTKYPVGTFIETEQGYFYILNNETNKRLRLITSRVLDSWAPHRVATSTEAAVSSYRIAGKMKFRNGSLLYSQASGKMYLVSENKICHVRNPDVLSLIGAERSEAVWVSSAELKLHEEGVPLD